MQVIVATGNAGKLREFTRIFAPFGIEVVGQKTLYPELEVEESGATFAENAFLKAQAVHALSGKAAVADDSGLCIDALGGRPGVYSARYAGEDTSYPEKMQRLLEELKEVPQGKRTARFVSHICFISEQGERIDAQGVCEGEIGFAPAGENGFGYDPLFYVGERSFAQLGGVEKDALSHRGKALRALVEQLEQLYTVDGAGEKR